MRASAFHRFCCSIDPSILKPWATEPFRKPGLIRFAGIVSLKGDNICFEGAQDISRPDWFLFDEAGCIC